MQTLDAIQSRRSVRAFRPDPVEPELIDRLVAAAASAPSAGNARPLAYISLLHPKRLRALHAVSPGMSSVPPAVIVMLFDHRRLPAPGDPTPWIDLGAALENLLLAAVDAGLGACPIRSFHPTAVRTLLDLPSQDWEPVLIVALGRPLVIPSPAPQPALDSIYFREGFPRS